MSAGVPNALAQWVHRVDLVPPMSTEDPDMLFGVRCIDELWKEVDLDFGTVDTAQHNRQLVARELQGLDAAAVNLVLEATYETVLARGILRPSMGEVLDHVRAERKKHLQSATGLSIEPANESFKLGGMRRLVRYLEYAGVIFHDRRAGIADGPRLRGLLLVGLPGCGKSLAAKIAARTLGVPLLRLDMGSIMGRYLGESEANLARATQAAEAAAPCVLWIDELEKALGGMGGAGEGHGTGSRLLGQLLTWMQEHRSSVYLFATANAVQDRLPPELLRRGRFDELWRVMLPTDDERREILQLRLDELGADRDVSLTAEKLVACTVGYTGADIGALINEAWLIARVQQKVVSFDVVQQVVAEGFAPMSVQFKDQIATLTKVLTSNGFRDVSVDDERSLKALAPVPKDRLSPLPQGFLRDLWQAQAPLRVALSSVSDSAKSRWLFVLPAASGRRWLVLEDSQLSGESFPAECQLVRFRVRQQIGLRSADRQVSSIVADGESWTVRLNGESYRFDLSTMSSFEFTNQADRQVDRSVGRALSGRKLSLKFRHHDGSEWVLSASGAVATLQPAQFAVWSKWLGQLTLDLSSVPGAELALRWVSQASVPDVPPALHDLTLHCHYGFLNVPQGGNASGYALRCLPESGGVPGSGLEIESIKWV
jgi:hypothetical protein